MDRPVVVLGGGVIGMSIFRYLTLNSSTTTHCLTISPLLYTTLSSRNSGVLHTGLHGPTVESKKVQWCKEGREMIENFCAKKGVNVLKCGKIMVANDEDGVERLKQFKLKGEALGVSPKSLSSSEVRNLEPNVACMAGVHFPSTSVVDVLGLCEAMETDALSEGKDNYILTSSRVTKVSADGQGGYNLEVTQGNSSYELPSSCVVNACGLDAPYVYQCLFGGDGVRHYFCKGHYYSYSDRSIVSSPVYPLPTADGGGLGIHSTKTVDGEVIFGPDVEWMDVEVGEGGLTDMEGKEREYWGVENEKEIKERFVESIRTYLPALDPDRLNYSHCGIRPKLSHPSLPRYQRQHDFYVGEDRPGWINLFGIESPGLTSSMKIGQVVGDMVRERVKGKG